MRWQRFGVLSRSSAENEASQRAQIACEGELRGIPLVPVGGSYSRRAMRS